ncbi:RsfS/YbeB/iojap family protein [Engelhardtia mirabilis]|uniref:Ribosomal silencing factor RsfS n=1 Tax=Engelhardtia mirabilis TaxID=2528011 RepID=A0A518BNV6_9BACT|nr:Ribosomal silencing factor RsfS [Planctomycetes bacterium Pla133]QDV02992.1 Ribosomal silencing factor RsfS [Planctomycetes bacterium Pla86]
MSGAIPRLAAPRSPIDPVHAPNLPETPIIDAKQLAVVAARIADEKKGEEIQVIEVGDQLKVADYFVIVSGTSRAHVRALYNDLHVRLKAAGHQHPRPEGVELGWWVVLDYGDVVVHILQPEAREYYDIERLYSDCPRVELADEPAIELPEAPAVHRGG